jgi:hypothetical protein
MQASKQASKQTNKQRTHTQIPTVLKQDVEWFLLCQGMEHLPLYYESSSY